MEVIRCNCGIPYLRKTFSKEGCAIYWCPECFSQYADFNICQHEFKPVVYITENGKRSLRETCINCFQRKDRSKMSLYDLSKIPIRNNEKYHEFVKENQEPRRKFQQELGQKQSHATLQRFRDTYSDYINSTEWKNKRNKVMKRDNYTCQICASPAKDVHHLTYQNFRNEYLFELVALCRSCHLNVYHEGRESDL